MELTDDPEQQFGLGLFYKEGYGTKRNPQEALKWLKKAASQSHAEAMFQIVDMFENGLGVGKNKDIALKWYRNAAKLEFGPAIEKVRYLTKVRKSDRVRAEGSKRNQSNVAADDRVRGTVTKTKENKRTVNDRKRSEGSAAEPRLYKGVAQTQNETDDLSRIDRSNSTQNNEKISTTESSSNKFFLFLLFTGALLLAPVIAYEYMIQLFIPITVLAGIFLGSKLGAFSVITYIIILFLELPFSDYRWFGVTENPFLGFELGLIFIAFIVGKVVESSKELKWIKLIITILIVSCLYLVFAVGYMYYFNGFYYIEDLLFFMEMFIASYSIEVAIAIIISLLAFPMIKRKQ